MSAYAKLRRRRQLFVDAYVRTGIGSAAAVESGYTCKRPEVAASKILANLEVKAAIAERTELAIAKAGVRHVRVLEEVALLAYANLGQLRAPDGKPVAFKDLPADFLAGAQSIEFNTDGSVSKVRLAKVDGLRMLGQYLKLFTEVLEHQGKDGGPIQTETREVSDLEKARRIAHLLTQGLRAQAPASVLTDPVSDDVG
jgi:phage terminase small subunit